MPQNTTRRTFLKQLVFANSSGVKDPGTQTLVCVFLRGGADTLNMLVPYGDPSYYKVRPTISIPPPGKGKDACLRIDDFYGFHPKLAGLLPIFSDGALGLVQGAGSDNPTGSHFDAQDQMEHGAAYASPTNGGWLGRYLRTRMGENLTPLSAVAIAEVIPESFRGSPVTTAIRKLEEIRLDLPDKDSEAVCDALRAMYSADADILKAPGVSTVELLRRVEKFKGRSYKPENSANYADDPFSQGLKEVARLIKADVGLEVACVDLNGWDTHFFQGGAEGQQAVLIEQFGNGLAAFYRDLNKLNKQVSTIAITEFGRRIYENGSLGTDHGRGFAFFAMGAGVKGGKIHGRYPGLQDDQYELGPGGLKITCDYRNCLSDLLAWRKAPIGSIFPGLQYDPSGLLES